MIRTVADLITRLIAEETAALANEPTRHGTTIGDMYENYFRGKIFKRALPDGVNLFITDGFITFPGRTKKCPQIDCMLVRNMGRKIPETDHHEVDIEDVIAIIEVKKTLYAADLKKSFEHSKAIRDLELEYLQIRNPTPMTDQDTASVLNAFENITAVKFLTDPEASNIEKMADLKEELSALGFTTELEVLNNLSLESWSILRVVFGYNGYASEQAFREKLIDQIAKVVTAGQTSGETAGTNLYNPGAFPHLIVSGGYSLCKMNGQPYMARLKVDGKADPRDPWQFYTSTDTSPIRLFLEYLWTRLARHHNIDWAEEPASSNSSEQTAPDEIMRPFLQTWVMERVENKVSWGIEPVSWDAVKHTLTTG